MTCIVAAAHKGRVWMGADSAGTSGWDLTIRKDPKIYIVEGGFAFGFTTSFRMGQVLGYKFKPPVHEAGVPLDEYMATTFVDTLRQVMKDAGYSKSDNGREEAGHFLAAYRGRVFCVESDYQVREALSGYDAVGCGAAVACGAMYASKGRNPELRIRAALAAAEAHSAGVRGPFMVVKCPL